MFWFHALIFGLFLCFYPPSIPITGVPVYPWKHSQLDLVGRGNHTQKAFKASNNKIHPLLYGHLMEFEQCTASWILITRIMRISTGQFLEHLRGSRFYPDKNVSCLDQNVASSTNLRICIYIYMRNLLNLLRVNLFQGLVESTGVNLMWWVFFQKMRGSPPKKMTPTNLRSWPESIHWESRLTNVAPEMVGNAFVSSPKKLVAGIDWKTHTKPDA